VGIGSYPATIVFLHASALPVATAGLIVPASLKYNASPPASAMVLTGIETGRKKRYDPPKKTIKRGSHVDCLCGCLVSALH
jgi:hypothetical protein